MNKIIRHCKALRSNPTQLQSTHSGKMASQGLAMKAWTGFTPLISYHSSLISPY